MVGKDRCGGSRRPETVGALWPPYLPHWADFATIVLNRSRNAAVAVSHFLDQPNRVQLVCRRPNRSFRSRRREISTSNDGQVSAVQAKLTAKSRTNQRPNRCAAVSERPVLFSRRASASSRVDPAGNSQAWADLGLRSPPLAAIRRRVEHFGYSLQLEKSAPNDGQNHWKLIFTTMRLPTSR